MRLNSEDTAERMKINGKTMIDELSLGRHNGIRKHEEQVTQRPYLGLSADTKQEHPFPIQTFPRSFTCSVTRSSSEFGPNMAQIWPARRQQKDKLQWKRSFHRSKNILKMIVAKSEELLYLRLKIPKLTFL